MLPRTTMPRRLKLTGARKVTPRQVLHKALLRWLRPGFVTYAYELPPGTHAIGIFHDADLNNKMDDNFFGVPKE